MEVPLFVLAIVGLLQVSFAEKVCLIAGQIIASPSDQTFYYKCIAPGVSVQLRCPSGERFFETVEKCVDISDPLAGKQLPTAPTPALTAPTQKPVKSESSAVGIESVPVKAPVISTASSGGSEPVTRPPSAPTAKKGKKTTKRQRATTPAAKPNSKKRTTAASNGKKKVVTKRPTAKN